MFSLLELVELFPEKIEQANQCLAQQMNNVKTSDPRRLRDIAAFIAALNVATRKAATTVEGLLAKPEVRELLKATPALQLTDEE